MKRRSRRYAVMLRPYPTVTVLRNMTRELAQRRGVLGEQYWELPLTRTSSSFRGDR
jgi:hypothetical protein